MQGLTVRAVNSISTKKEEICVKNEEPPPPHTPHQNSSDLDILDKVWHFLFLQFLAKRGKAKKKKKINKCLVSGNVKIFYGSVGRQKFFLEINLYRKSMKIIQN